MPRTGFKPGLQSRFLAQNDQRRERDLSRRVSAQFESPENPENQENPRQMQKIQHKLKKQFE